MVDLDPAEHQGLSGATRTRACGSGIWRRRTARPPAAGGGRRRGATRAGPSGVRAEYSRVRVASSIARGPGAGRARRSKCVAAQKRNVSRAKISYKNNLHTDIHKNKIFRKYYRVTRCCVAPAAPRSRRVTMSGQSGHRSDGRGVAPPRTRTRNLARVATRVQSPHHTHTHTSQSHHMVLHTSTDRHVHVPHDPRSPRRCASVPRTGT